MTTEKMTIHEALSELKVIGKRIDKEVNGAVFVTTNKHSNTKIGGKTIEEFSDNIKSKYQKITDLIKRREAIKRAVTQSNAITVVNISGQEMTVAEAIEYKKSGVAFKENLLGCLSLQYNRTTDIINRTNGDNLETKADDYVIKMYGNKDSGIANEVIEIAKKNYIDNNSLDMIDPLDVSKIIAELNDEIDKFMTKVDSALSVSNATTMIEISY